MGAPRIASAYSANPKTVVIGARVSFEVCALIDHAARILSTKRTKKRRQDVLVEGATRFAREVVRSAAALKKRRR